MSARITSIVPASRLDRLARESMLLVGLDLIRSAGIFGSAELHEVVKAVHESCRHKDERTEQLSDLLIDLQGDVFYPPEPEVLEYSGRERGQLDSGTAGVRHRSAA